MNGVNTSSVQAAQAFNAGNAAFKAGDWQRALACADAALQLDAGLVFAALLRARCLVRLGEWMPAREAFAQTLRLDAANFSAWLEAGHLCKQMGELMQAAATYQHAINAAPERYEAYLAMARVMAQQGQTELANRAYNDAVQAAMAKDADAVRQVHWLMGQYVLELGHANEALACFNEALKATKAESPLALANLAAEVQMDAALAWLRVGQRDKAMKLLTLASAATNEATLSRLAALSYRNNFWQEAIEISRRCVALYPKSAWAHWNLAHLLAECWQMEEAELVLQQAEALASMPGARSLRAAVAGRVGDADQALALFAELARDEGQGSMYASSAAMSSLYSDSQSAQQVADLHRILFASWGEGARSRESFVRKPLEGRRVKLGLVSADFHHQHPVNIFMQPVLRELDRSKFELFVYFVGDSHDEQTAMARSRTEHWVEVGAFNSTQLAKRIDADEVDVLLDMAGHTSQHRMQLFAQRAAPVQMTYLGYPGSTGVPNMDFIVGDEVVTPKGCESLYSEQVLRLPGTVFCFAPEEDYAYPKFKTADAKRTLTFGSFNNVPKLTPRTLKLWARVLAAVPDSRLVLKAPSFSDEAAKRIFGERLQGLGVDLSRVEFRGPVGLTDMMAEYADIDIALDPVPYNGGTTSLQAMWMGVPVLTQMGAHFVSRMGASFMTAAGLPEWVAQDDDDYVAIAKRMASDRKALLALKKGLRERLQKIPAWDVVAHTRALEQAILTAVNSRFAKG
jgi:predicted O-linked N-acetylglucosamine transferase (SPINDLY family)